SARLSRSERFWKSFGLFVGALLMSPCAELASSHRITPTSTSPPPAAMPIISRRRLSLAPSGAFVIWPLGAAVTFVSACAVLIGAAECVSLPVVDAAPVVAGTVASPAVVPVVAPVAGEVVVVGAIV